MPRDHNAVLAARAREVLRPMGLSQRGRSRTWQEDRGCWLLMVDFQASGFGKATYLNVFVHWLWRLGDDPLTGQSMDYGNRVAGSGAFFKDEGQWTAAVVDVVARAAEEVLRYRALVPDLAAAAAACVAKEEERIADVVRRDGSGRDHVSASWGAWHAAVASGMVGDTNTAEHYFERLIRLPDDREYFAPYRELSHRWRRLVREDHALFVEEVAEIVTVQRSRLKLSLLQPSQFMHQAVSHS